jgi:hypothetical protein
VNRTIQKKEEYVDREKDRERTTEDRSVDSEIRKGSKRKKGKKRKDNGNTFTVNLEKKVRLVYLRDAEHSFIYSYARTTNNSQNDENFQ